MDEQLPSMPYSGAVAKDRCPVCRATFEARNELLSHLQFSDCRTGRPVLPSSTSPVRAASPPHMDTSPRGGALGSKILKLISPRRHSVSDLSPMSSPRSSMRESFPGVPLKVVEPEQNVLGGGSRASSNDLMSYMSGVSPPKEPPSPRKEGNGSPRREVSKNVARVKKSGSTLK